MLKVSCSQTHNSKSVLTMYNKIIFISPGKPRERLCNCVDKMKYLLKESSLTNNVRNPTTISSREKSCRIKFYYEITIISLKFTYMNQQKSFSHINYI